jgi:hypothetical protein
MLDTLIPKPRLRHGMSLAIPVLVVAFSRTAFGQNEAADAAFCEYTVQRAMAQRDLLRTPSLTMGPIQPSTGTPAQFVMGVTNSLSDRRKASVAMTIARNSCELYKRTSEAQMHLQYALPILEQDALNRRVEIIHATLEKLDGMIAERMKLVDAQNLTLPAVYPLQSVKIRLDVELIAATTAHAAMHVPQLTDVPLRVLIAEKLASENQTQSAEAKLLKQSGWDVQVSAGVRQSLATGAATSPSRTGPYGAVHITYNFGLKSIDRHLDNAAGAYNTWKKTQFDDVAAQAALLRTEILDRIANDTKQLGFLLEHDATIEKSIRALDGVDTTNAIGFRNNLLADQLVLRVDMDSTQFRMQRLQKYLTENF